jgi:hypothetical protein
MKKIKTFILEHFEGAIIGLVFLGIIAIAFFVYYKLSFLNFFFIPVILTGYFLGKKKAVLIGFFCVLLVILYFAFLNLLAHQEQPLALSEIIIILAWASFLIVTGGIIGEVSERREKKVKNMRSSYIGVLDILLKYLQVADEAKPQSVRVSHLAGNIGEAAELGTSEVEDIKSAALLYEAGDLRSTIPLFGQVAEFMERDRIVSEMALKDKDKVLLKTIAALLKKIEPILVGYYIHYVEQASVLEKDLGRIPLGSSIIALADIYDNLSTGARSSLGTYEIKSLADIEKLSGRSFHDTAVNALMKAIPSS